MARVAFVQDVIVEYMGFMCMSSVLKEAGHTVDVFIDEQVRGDRVMHELAAFRPDVVGFSLLSPSLPWALALAKRVKDELGAITIVGNVHVMMAPDIVHEDGIDIACLGEGEYVMRELCDALDSGRDYSQLRGCWVKAGTSVVKNPMRTELVVMDDMPYIDRSMYDRFFFFRHSPYLRVMFGRGCPFRCSFCSNGPMADHFGGMKNYIRKRRPASAVAEVKHLIAQHRVEVKHIFVIDEVLWVKNDWLREFLEIWKREVALPFTASFRFGAINEDDIKLMAEAKAGPVTMSTESADEVQRQTVLGKPVTNAQILRIAGWLHNYGIEFGSSAFFGLPGDTVQDHIYRLEFFRTLKPKYLWTTFFQPYPGLELTEKQDVQEHLPVHAAFQQTFHHDMYLELPNRQQLVNLKKVYYLMMRFPWTERPLLWLTQFRIPLLFDVIFLSHFTYYAFWWEHVSPLQFLYHVKIFALNPLLRRKQPLPNSGRPYTIPETRSAAAPAA